MLKENEEIDKAIEKAKKEGKCIVPEFADLIEEDEDLDRLAEQIAWVANRFNGIHKSINYIADTKQLEEALILRSCYLEILVELSEKFDRIMIYIP